MDPLPDVLTVGAAVGAVLGATIGFAVPPKNDRELVKNVVNGAQIGAVLGSAFGLIFWIGGSAAGA